MNATPAQISYLRDLGYTGSAEIGKDEASALISSLKVAAREERLLEAGTYAAARALAMPLPAETLVFAGETMDAALASADAFATWMANRGGVPLGEALRSLTKARERMSTDAVVTVEPSGAVIVTAQRKYGSDKAMTLRFDILPASGLTRAE